MVDERGKMERKGKKSIFNLILIVATLVLAIAWIASIFIPDGAVLKATILGQNICFFLLSVWAWLFVIWIIREVQSILEVRFTKRNLIAIAVTLTILFAYYAYSLLTRQFIYYWDFVHYYQIQLGVTENFQTVSFFIAATDVIKSIWYHSYTQFISVFLAAPFTFTPKTVDWFVAASAVAILPTLYWAIAIFIKMLERILQPVRSDYFFVGGMILAAGFPLIHWSLLYGQPDLLGLVFAFLIVVLTIQYDFSKTDIKRYFLIVILTIMTIVSRRWYLFWLVAYYACYGFAIAFHTIRNKRWMDLRRAALFCISAGASIAVVLLPKIVRLAKTDYAESYEFYNVGGLSLELSNQSKFLGIGLLVIITAGFLWGVFRRRTRGLSILAAADLALIIVLFTRIQNMGYHHMMILVPAYLLLMLNCLAGICRLEKKRVFQVSAMVLLVFSLSNAAICGTASTTSMPALFSKVPLKLPRRNDIEKIREVNRWLVENCSESESAYMIPHGYPYNPDIFRCCDLPDGSVSARLPYGSAILGTHYFPEELFSAKYVITCEPFCNASIAEKYNSAFLSETSQKHFIEATRFDMGNGYVFIVYQRTMPADREEVQYYIDFFSQEDALFPELFSGVLDQILLSMD